MPAGLIDPKIKKTAKNGVTIVLFPDGGMILADVDPSVDTHIQNIEGM